MRESIACAPRQLHGGACLGARPKVHRMGKSDRGTQLQPGGGAETARPLWFERSCTVEFPWRPVVATASAPCDWHSARALSLLWPGGVFLVSFLAVASWGGTAVRRDTRRPQHVPRAPHGDFACAAHWRNTRMPDVQHDTFVIQPSQLLWLADRECALRGHVHVCFVFHQRLCTSIVGVGRCANAALRGGSLW